MSNMKKELKFVENRHQYFLDGKLLTGCTSVLSVISKPALIQWSANMAVDYIFSKIPEYSKLHLSEKEKMKWVENIMREARTANLRKKEDAGQKGTDTHKEIENIIKKVIKENKGFISKILKHKERLVQNFIYWAVKNKVQFLESEKRMYSEKYFVGGTCDFTCIIDGKKYVGDIKTSSGIYGREPFAQTACYRMMLEEMGEKGFEGSIIVNIKKNGIFNENEDVHL